MNDTNDSKQNLTFIMLVCGVYFLLTVFYHHVDKYLSGLLFIILTLLIPVTFIIIVVFEIKGLINIFFKSQNRILGNLTPILICSSTLIYIIFCPYPYRLDSEKLESKVEFRACYEGTQNQAYIKFREDKSFELNWTGVFFSNNWWTGKWTKQGDTIFLKYNKNQIAKALGSKILIKDGYLTPIGNHMDTEQSHRPRFYLGYCRHEN